MIVMLDVRPYDVAGRVRRDVDRGLKARHVTAVSKNDISWLLNVVMVVRGFCSTQSRTWHHIGVPVGCSLCVSHS